MDEPLLPTPQASSNRKSRRAMTPSVDNGRRTGGGQSSPPALEQSVEILNGITPRELLGRTSAYSAGSAASTSPWSGSDSDASARSSGTRGAPSSSSDTGRLFPVGETFGTSSRHIPTPTASDYIRRRSTNTGGPSKGELNYATGKSVSLDRWAEHDWTFHRPVDQGADPVARDPSPPSSAAGSPASPSPTPGGGRPRTTNGGSGPSSPVSFACLDPDGSWLRTYPDSSVQATLMGPPLARFSGTWPSSGSMRGGQVFAHPTSAPRIDGNGSSSSRNVPTPTAQDHIRRCSTSTETLNYEMGKSVSLDRWAEHWHGEMLPTPTTQDGANTAGPSQFNRHSLSLNAALLPTPHREMDHESGTDRNWRGDLTAALRGESPPGHPSPGDPTSPPSDDGSP